MKTNDPFYSAVMRTLGFVDLNPLSRTAGCCDRGYWHSQDGKGFPVGSFQAAMLAFHAASECFGEADSIFSVAGELSSSFWAREITKRGTLSEYYFGQDSFCATAHTTMAAAILAVANGREKKDQTALITGLRSALRWLCKQKRRPDSANQALAARLAWDLAQSLPAFSGELSGENPFLPKISSEGWFSEYGGFDLGYSLQCLDLCALALSVLEDKGQRHPYQIWAGWLIDFLHLVLVQFTFSPALSSRGNPHRLLGGLAIFAQNGDLKAKQIQNVLHLQQVPPLVAPETCDDKYLAFFHLNSLLLAFHAKKPIYSLLPHRVEKLSASEMLIPKNGFLHLKEAGLCFYSSYSVRLVFSLSQGGAFFFRGDEQVKLHSGYAWRAEDALYQTVGEKDHVEVSTQAAALHIRVPFFSKKVTERAVWVQNPFFQFGMKLVFLIPGTREILNRWIFDKVTKKVSNLQPVGHRTFLLSPSEVKVTDHFSKEPGNLHAVSHWCLTDGHSTRMHTTTDIPIHPTNPNLSWSYKRCQSPIQLKR